MKQPILLSIFICAQERTHIFFHSQQALNVFVALLLDGMNEMVEMNLLFIREVNYSSFHATSHLSSMLNTKCATCHLYLMHLATCQCMQLSTLPYMKNVTCLTCTMDRCLVTKVALPVTILGLDHHLGKFHS
jgi:hypothetical protein